MGTFSPNGFLTFPTKGDQQDIKFDDTEFEAELEAHTEFIENGEL